jgi:hypothetical protein
VNEVFGLCAFVHYTESLTDLKRRIRLEWEAAQRGVGQYEHVVEIVPPEFGRPIPAMRQPMTKAEGAA